MEILDPHLPPPAFAMVPRSVRDITDLIVHHEAGSVTQTPQEVDAEHRAEGWAMCGYNFIIDQAGRIYRCRPLDVVPSAAYGRNAESVNVSLVGNFQKDDPGFTGPPRPNQIAALKELAIYLHKTIPTICRTIGHRDVATLFYGGDGDYATACPGSELYVLLPEIKHAIAAAINPHH